MNTNRNENDSAARPPLRRRKSKAGRNAGIIAILVLLGAASAWAVWGTGRTGGWAKGLWEKDTGLDAGKVHVVKRGPLTISIRQSGTIHHRDKVIVKSKLEGSSTVIWIIDEGKPVEVGDLLLELDSSGFEQKKELQDIVVINSEASLISATEALAVTKNAARTAVDDAKLAIHLAELDLMKYVGRVCYENYQQIRERFEKAQAVISRHEDHAERVRQLKTQLAEAQKVMQDDPRQAKDVAEQIQQIKAQLAEAEQVAAKDAKTAKDDAALVGELEKQLEEALALVAPESDARSPGDDTKDDPEKAAALVAELATEALKKYAGGEFYQQVKEAQATITMAIRELAQAKEREKWSAELAKDGYVTSTELEADKLDAKRTELSLSSARSKLSVLLKYTHIKSMAQLVNDLGKAERALDPIKRKAAADIKQAEAKLKASESEHKQQLALLAKAKSQIKECKVYAPVAGKVVYASTTSHSWRHSSEPLKEGGSVYERRELFHMPGKDKIMMSVVKIPQASLKKVLDDDGAVRPLSARITIAEAKDKYFPATLAKVAPMPDNIPWYRGDQSIKVFATEVHLNEVHPDLSAGFRCEVEIIVAQYEDVLSIPLQAVTTVRGKSTVYVRQAGQREFKPRVVKLGLDNNRAVHVISGLSEDEEVLLEPPLDEAETDKDKNGANGGRKAATTRPAARRRGKGGGMPKGISSMTPEERKKAFEKLTPEQKAALRKRMGGGDKGGGDKRPAGRPGTPGPAGGGRGRQ